MAIEVDNWSKKYRPKNFKQMVGQTLATTLLQSAFDKGKVPRTFIISGETGHGKTTLSRIIAEMVNDGKPWEKNSDVVDVNAGADGGIEKIRALISTAHHMPQFGNYRVFIIDECHKLTGAAQNAALKFTEEPPGRSMIIMLTNKPDMLPEELLGRGLHIRLAPVEAPALLPYLSWIGKQENAFQPPQQFSDIYKWCAESAGGQPRKAVQLFQMAALLEGKMDPKKIIVDLLSTYGDTPEKMALNLLCGIYSYDMKRVIIAIQGTQDPTGVIRQALYISQSYIENKFGCLKWSSIGFKQLAQWMNKNSAEPTTEYLMKTHVELAQLLDNAGYSTASKNATIMARIGLLIEGQKKVESGAETPF